MNYRHLYHAGNFADVIKHIVLLASLNYLQKKEGPLCVIDAHGGAGLYDLSSEEAAKTGEWEKGVGRIKGRADAPGGVQAYLDAVRKDLSAGRYPGSPLLIARALRPQDRLIANELHEPTFDALRQALAPFQNARATRMDAYECIRAHIPPQERRGLVLIDPPFEEKDEFETLARQMRQWRKRWETGVFVLWHPIKAHQPMARLIEAAQDARFRRTWRLEMLIRPRGTPDALNGCGLIVFNAPYTVPEQVNALSPFLKEAMDLHDMLSVWDAAEA